MYHKLVFLVFCFTFSLCISGQESFPLHGGSGFKFNNPVNGEEQASIYVRIRSTKENAYYERILGGDAVFLELADRDGKLELYDGKQWHNLELEIKNKFVDLFLLFDAGNIKVYSGTKLLHEQTHAYAKEYRSEHIYLGCNHTFQRQLTGSLQAYAVFSRILGEADRGKILKDPGAALTMSEVKISYDYRVGKYFFETEGTEIKNISEIVMDSPPAPVILEREGSPKVEKDVPEILPKLDIYLVHIDDTNKEYGGHFTHRSPMKIPEGRYELIVGKNGKLSITPYK